MSVPNTKRRSDRVVCASFALAQFVNAVHLQVSSARAHCNWRLGANCSVRVRSRSSLAEKDIFYAKKEKNAYQKPSLLTISWQIVDVLLSGWQTIKEEHERVKSVSKEGEAVEQICSDEETHSHSET